MAFDEARSSSARPGRGARGGAKGGASGFDAVAQGGSVASASSSARATSAMGSYQGGDQAYNNFREALERDLRKLTALAAATRTQVEKLGGKADGAELRKRM